MTSRQKGFSMLEVIMAITLFSIMSTSLFYFLSTQNKYSTNASDMTKGIHLGKHKLDSLKVTDYDQLTAGSDTVADRYIRTWSVSPQTTALGTPSGRKLVDVQVFWPLTAEHSMTFTTLLSDDKYKENQ